MAGMDATQPMIGDIPIHQACCWLILCQCRWVEYINAVLKSRNISHSGFDGLVEFSHNLKAICHVDANYSEVYGEVLDTPMTARGNYTNDISALLRYHQTKIGDHHAHSSINPFQGDDGVDIEAGDYRLRKPWEYVRSVSQGRSAPIMTHTRLTAEQYVSGYLEDHMYPY